MRSSIASTALIAAVLTALAALAPATASAREGARSIGGGIKCYAATVVVVDGVSTIQRICFKSI